MKFTRRKAIIGGIVGGGLLGVGFWFARERDRLGSRTLFNVKPDEAGLNGWVKITRDNSVIVAVPRAEMGQGVQTALAMLVAEEMDARWDQVRVEDPPEDGVYRNVDILIDGLPFSPEETGTVVDVAHWIAGKLGGVLGVLATGGSTVGARCLAADAHGRRRGARSAAARGQPQGRHSGRRLDRERRRGPPQGRQPASPPSANWSTRSAISRRCRRRRSRSRRSSSSSASRCPGSTFPPRSTGAATFGIDVRLPDLLYAAVRTRRPSAARATGFKVKQGALPKGVETVIIVPGGIAAIGSSWWRANKLLARGSRWSGRPGPEPELDSAALWRRYEELMQTASPRSSAPWARRASRPTVQPLEATYRAPYLAHTTMEPMNCTAQVIRHDGGKQGVEVWMPNQSPTLMRYAAARRPACRRPSHGAHDLPGRRLRPARRGRPGAPGRRPARWPCRSGRSRSCGRARRTSATTTIGRWRWRAGGPSSMCRAPRRGSLSVAKRQVAQSPTDQFPARVLGLPAQGKPEGNAVENPPYAFPSYRLEAVVAEGSVPVGFWRSVGHSHTAFFDESFVDEMAAALTKDPFEFRRELLARKPRHLAVLETAAREAGWGTPLPAGSGRGIALRASFGSIVAQVAEVAVADGKTLQVKRVTCAIDCGPVVNPAIVRAQMESGIVYGLTAALYGEITLANGAVEQANFPDYDAVRLADAPEMAVHIVDSGASFIGGVGEPGTPPIAPAVANAVFAATGKRLRNLPLRLD